MNQLHFSSEDKPMRHHPLAECETCPLFEIGEYVPSTQAKGVTSVALVGEAPGANEAETGEPFTGASGRLLDSLLIPADIKRKEAFITNTCLCRPPENANPPAQAIKACRPRLVAELNEADPLVIFTLGAVASKNLLQTTKPITQLRLGPPKRSPLLDSNHSVIPTYHPAAALYNSDTLPDIITDFKKLDMTARTDWEPPTYEVIESPIDVRNFLAQLVDEGKPVALDIEVGVDKEDGYTNPSDRRLLCIGLTTHKDHVVVLGKRACAQWRSWKESMNLMLDKCPIIAHNGKFDLNGLRRFHDGKAKLWFDTMLASYALDERKGTNSLQYLSIELLGSPDWKYQVDQFLGPDKNYDNIPAETLYKYNAYDVANTYRLYLHFASALATNRPLYQLQEFLVDSSNTLMNIEHNGLSVDSDYLNQLQVRLDARAVDIRGELRNIVGKADYNPNSPMQVKNMLANVFGQAVDDTRAETILRIQEKSAGRSQHDLFDFCEKHLEFKRLSKQSGTYVKGIRQRLMGNRVHTSFLLHGTVTGRLSSRNPNLQNIPRDDTIKRIFMPNDTNNWLVQCDYRQAELRVVAWLAKDEYLRGVLSDPERDIHGEVAAQIFGPNFTKEQRVKAKAVVFGVTYGMEAPYLSALLKITPGEARKYIDGWFEMIPATTRWISKLEQSVLDTGRVQSPIFGHTRRFWHITNSNRRDVLKEARAFLPQNIASNICLAAANQIRKIGYGDAMRILVHDAIVFEVDDPKNEMVTRIRDSMQSMGLIKLDAYIPMPVDLAYGRNWGSLADELVL